MVLMYHNIVPSRDAVAGDRSLHLPRPDFARQLEYLQSVCDIVPLGDLIGAPSGNYARFRVAITFDDAYVGALTLGVAELTRRGLPATVFAPPGLLGQETWWDVLGAASSNGMRPHDRDLMLREFKGEGDLIRRSAQWDAARRDSPLQRELRIADVALLAESLAHPGITIGSHTWTHPNLAAIEPDVLEAELVRPLEWIRDRFSSFVPFITYPYGMSSRRVEEAAMRAGYSAGFVAGGGWLPLDIGGCRFGLPRFDVSSGLSLDGLRLRLGGFGST